MKEKHIEKDDSAMDYLGYALYAFGGLGLEILLMMIETNLWDVQSNAWSVLQHIIHWSITCLVWGVFAFVLLKKASKKHVSFQAIHWMRVGIIVGCSILLTSYVWGGFKPFIELRNLGTLKFIVQTIYYAFESLLILLIVMHGQEAFELSTNRNSNFPIGGLILAMTWGVVHMLTQGIPTGIYTCVQSLLYGLVYLGLKKDIKFSYVAITFMFML